MNLVGGLGSECSDLHRRVGHVRRASERAEPRTAIIDSLPFM